MPAPVSAGLLAEVRVLDFTIWRPGPYATQLLAELGADVIKVEPPGGDPMRAYPGLFEALHADKRGIVLDLKSVDDRARAHELAAEADVAIEGYRPGVADRLGVGYEQLRAVNPSIVYCSVSGLGQDGPLRLVPGHDLNYLAWAGALAPEGGEPALPAVPVADLAGGMAAALAVCAAVVRRARTGEGERIDVAMADVVASWTGAVKPRAEGVERGSEGVDRGGGGVPGYGVFNTGDGQRLTLGVLTEDHFWLALCDVLGLAEQRELPWLERATRTAELQGAIAAAIGGRDLASLLAELLAAGVPAAPVHDRDGVLAHPHFTARGLVITDPWSREPAMGHPVRFLRHPARREMPPPRLDEHHGCTFHPR